jgi:hypothetical protein
MIGLRAVMAREWSDADGRFSPPAESAHQIKRVL